MPNVFDNLKSLKQDMQLKGWVISAFDFNFKGQRYIVLVKLFGSDEAKPKYALVKMEFLREDDFNTNLIVCANSSGLDTDPKTLREFFNIDYDDNLGNILVQFYKHLAKFIPDKFPDDKTELQKQAMCKSLSESDSEDPRKIYCKSVRRNGKSGQRSPYNDNKTKLLRRELHERLHIDTNLSFCYSLNPADENSDEVIVSNWIKNKV